MKLKQLEALPTLGTACIELGFETWKLGIFEAHLKEAGYNDYVIENLGGQSKISIKRKDVLNVSAIRDLLNRADTEAVLVQARDFLKKAQR